MSKLMGFVKRLAEEPPFRLVSRAFIQRLPCSIRTKARWEAVARPNYLVGILAAADQAKREGKKAISVYEFGVASGAGLLEMADMAEAVERETGIKIIVYGFDAGSGLPDVTGDYRDHPDQWMPGDYPMNEPALRKRLKSNTKLIIGEIGTTLPAQLPYIEEPIGFVSIDVDLYSSTQDVFRMFTVPKRRMLKRVFMYFDDIDFAFNHKFAGELLAIDEFNAANKNVKIDRWHGIKKLLPFADSPWLDKMYIAHDIDAISRFSLKRQAAVIAFDDTARVVH